MRDHLRQVGERLSAKGVTGEIVLAGGAVMVLALNARGSSGDIDAVFTREAEAIREAAAEVAEAEGLPAIWLNEHVQVFVAPDAPTVDLFELPGLRVRMVRLDYLFYMKAWAGDPVDQRDLRAIAKVINVKDEHEAYGIVRRYSSGELSEEVQILLESLFE
jgi:predicted nucleotidyltransferase